VDISVTVCFSVFVRLRITPPRTKLAASNFARRYTGVQGRETPIFVKVAPLKVQNWSSRPAHHHFHDVHNDYPLASGHMNARRVGVGSACVDGYTSVPEDGRTCIFYIFSGPQSCSCLRGSACLFVCNSDSILFTQQMLDLTLRAAWQGRIHLIDWIHRMVFTAAAFFVPRVTCALYVRFRDAVHTSLDDS